jgi:hypothetical protein
LNRMARRDDYHVAAFFRFAFANGDGALPALIAAHRFRTASAIAFRPTALILRLRRTGATAETAGANALGGRPRRFTGPCRAWIAASRRFRSATSKATMCSVGINQDRNTCACVAQMANFRSLRRRFGSCMPGRQRRTVLRRSHPGLVGLGIRVLPCSENPPGE